MDIQGHRGCRGLLPENTIPAFLHAIDLGVTTLELDTVITKDHKVLISHEPFFNHEISTDPNGVWITKENEKDHNIYQLDYDQIKKYDVGLKPHPRFPEQAKIACQKPLLSELLDKTFRKYPSLKYNIEIKRKPEGDELCHPRYDRFTNLLIETLEPYQIADRVTIQCFDVETLNYLHQRHLSFKIAYLVEEEDDHVLSFSKIEFTPDIYSPDFKLVNPALIQYCKENAIELIPWTVNNQKDIEQMITWNLDGIISDFPDRVINALSISH